MMSIQKQKQQFPKFSQIATSLQKYITQLQHLTNTKKAFVQKINHNIPALYALISDYPTVSAKQLSQMLDNSAIRLLIQNKKYMTLQEYTWSNIGSLGNYLGVSETSIKDSTKSSPNAENISNSNINILPKSLQKPKSLQIQTRYQLQDIINKQVQIMQNIQQTLTFAPPDILFNEIDFFSNGYIDASSFAQFVKHYSQTIKKDAGKEGTNMKINKLQQRMQLKFMDVIKFLKGSATAEKIFYADFLMIVQNNDQQIQQSNPQVISNTSAFITHHNQQHQHHQNHIGLSRSIGHIAKVSELEMIYSRARKNKNQHHNQPQSRMRVNIIPNTPGSHTFDIEHSHQFQHKEQKNIVMNIEDIEKMNKMVKEDFKEISYEEQICANHWRNAKYLEKLKINTTVTSFRESKSYFSKGKLPTSSKQCSNQNSHVKSLQKDANLRKAKQLFLTSFSPINDQSFPNQSSKINPSQIIYQLRYLSQIYDKLKMQIQKMIGENKKFTFVNAFNVIDINDQGYVSYKQLRGFLEENEIVINERKIQNFFHVLAEKYKANQQKESMDKEQKVIYYHRFILKIFKLKTTINSYQTCRKRRPLISQQWSQQQQINYCRFLRCMISNFHEIKLAKETLIKMFKLESINSMKELEQTKHQNEEKYNKIQNEMREKMEEVFKESDIHCQKLKQTLGKNSETFIGQLYEDQTVLQPITLINSLSIIF